MSTAARPRPSRAWPRSHRSWPLRRYCPRPAVQHRRSTPPPPPSPQHPALYHHRRRHFYRDLYPCRGPSLCPCLCPRARGLVLGHPAPSAFSRPPPSCRVCAGGERGGGLWRVGGRGGMNDTRRRFVQLIDTVCIQVCFCVVVTLWSWGLGNSLRATKWMSWHPMGDKLHALASGNDTTKLGVFGTLFLIGQDGRV